MRLTAYTSDVQLGTGGKMATKNNPGKYDCYENALPDEPMFVLLGRDPAAWAAVAIWCYLRDEDVTSEKIKEAFQCAYEMKKYAMGLDPEAGPYKGFEVNLVSKKTRCVYQNYRF